jgi:hypothetical protein
MIVSSPKKNRVTLICLSFLIGLALSSVLLHFLFGSSMYDKYRGLLAPSYNFLGIGVVGIVERSVSYVVDAMVFGVIIFLSVEALRFLPSALRRAR